jgi:hypothetical protein
MDKEFLYNFHKASQAIEKARIVSEKYFLTDDPEKGKILLEDLDRTIFFLSACSNLVEDRLNNVEINLEDPAQTRHYKLLGS